MKKIISVAALTGFALLTLAGCMENETANTTSTEVKPETTTSEAITDEANSDSNNSSSMKEDSDSINSDSINSTGSSSEMMTENMYEIEIDNQTGSDIYGLQYSITGSDNWADEYSKDTITNGNTAQITIPKGEEGEMFDIRAYDNQDMSGDGWIFPEIDFTNDGRIILRYKDNAPDYEYG